MLARTIEAIRQMADRRPVPDIVIGGAPRSGTTFLCEMLAKHQGIYIARPFIPEPKVCLITSAADDDARLARYATHFADAPEGLVRIEKTSNYFENEEARARLVRLLPQAKFVFILREPVARAYSNWLWSRKNGLETLSFAEAIRLEGRRPSPLPPERAYARPFDYMSRGRYGTLAEAWIRDVGRERVAFYILETSLGEPQAFVADLQRFIGVDPLPWEELQTSKINATEPDTAPLQPELAMELRDRIASEVERFAQISGVDVAVWGY